ncbi:MAG: hypothetical protein M3Z05_11220 [Gemmatimonadota bacterium]|nr:hypothetical protein [Gemmatimonadota bacterium]
MPSRRTLSLFALVSLLALVGFVSSPPSAAAAHPRAPANNSVVFFSAACVHDGWVVVSRYNCGGDSTTQMTVYQARDVESVLLTIKLKDHTTLTQQVPAGTDALFLSNVAITKFLRPYYVRVGDRTKAADLLAFTKHVVTLGQAHMRTLQTTPR